MEHGAHFLILYCPWLKPRFQVGVAHTNYVEYARRDRGEASAQVLKLLNSFVCALHCHKVIKLSDAVQPLPRQVRALGGVKEPLVHPC